MCCRFSWQFKSSPRGRQSAKRAVDAAATATATATAAASVAAVTASPAAAAVTATAPLAGATTGAAASAAAATAAAAPAPTTVPAIATTCSTIAVAPNGARQELTPPSQTATPDRRTDADLRNLPSMMDGDVIRKKRRAPSAPFPRSTRPR